ncbi:MAG: TIM barrel protein [Fimbriimonadaceae bacterium]|nr:TIM barrel protein [Fimbriimonadaceae bacterium]
MKLGGPTFGPTDDLDAWAREVLAFGYEAVNPPFGPETSAETRSAFLRLCETNRWVVAEVGVWNNPLAEDPVTRRDALDRCVACLELAEDLGARCAVNIAGSRGDVWDGPDVRNLDEDTIDLIVEQVRHIVDAVRPKRTFFTLETMPWIFPDSPESYLRLLDAVGRPAFAVHLDVANMIHSPPRFFGHAAFARRCVETLGPWVRSVHLKDLALSPRLTVHIDERAPGDGELDLGAMVRAMRVLPDDTPLLLEHLSGPDECGRAVAHVRRILDVEG